MRLVLTRPLPDSERTAVRLRERGHDVVLAPLLRIAPVEADLSGRWPAIVMTSANAGRALGAQSADFYRVPVFAVSRHTADAARAAGFASVISADGNADDLVRLIVAQQPKVSGPLLYLAGENRTVGFELALANSSIAVETRVVYRATRVSLASDLIALLKTGSIDAVLHFSRRSAEAFVSEAGASGVLAQALAVRHICLSDQVAAPLIAAGAVRITVAARPDEDAIVELAGST